MSSPVEGNQSMSSESLRILTVCVGSLAVKHSYEIRTSVMALSTFPMGMTADSMHKGEDGIHENSGLTVGGTHRGFLQITHRGSHLRVSHQCSSAGTLTVFTAVLQTFVSK